MKLINFLYANLVYTLHLEDDISNTSWIPVFMVLTEFYT